MLITAEVMRVPQGGNLSAALFIIYIKDLLHATDESVTDLDYADDICVLLSF